VSNLLPEAVSQLVDPPLAIAGPLFAADRDSERKKGKKTMKTNKPTAKNGAKKLVLHRETLKTLAPSSLSEVHGGIFLHFTLVCIIVTAPETFDGPECMPW